MKNKVNLFVCVLVALFISVQSYVSACAQDQAYENDTNNQALLLEEEVLNNQEAVNTDESIIIKGSDLSGNIGDIDSTDSL